VACKDGPQPGFIPIPATARVDIVGQYLATPVVTTFYVRTGFIWGEAELKQLVGVVKDWIAGTHSLLVASNAFYELVVARDYGVVAGASYLDAVGLFGNSGVAGLPSNNTLVTSFWPQNTGRRGHGRAYTWPLPQTVVTHNQVNVAFANAVNNAWTSLQDQLITEGWEQVCISLCKSGHWLSEADVYSIVNTTTRAHLTNLNRRLLKH
jgi:hypothetical protein